MLKEDLQNKSGEIAALKDALGVKVNELNALIDTVDTPVSSTTLELRTCPLNIAANFYPYEIHFHNGFLYVSTIGGNAGGSGYAKLIKYNYKTGAVVAEYASTVSYAAGAGFLGFCIVNNKAYVCCNKSGSAELHVVDLNTMAGLSVIPLGAGSARNAVTDGTYIYVALNSLKLKKVSIETSAVSDIYTFASGSEPFRTAYFDGKLWVCLFANHFNGNAVQVFDTNGGLLATINTGAASQPNWFGQTSTRLFISCYGTHRAYEINKATYALGQSYVCPASDAPHVPFPVLDKQLWLGGTAITGSNSYIRVFDINTGAIVKSIAQGANIPNMAFDGTAVWNISANGNLIQRNLLDLVVE